MQILRKILLSTIAIIGLSAAVPASASLIGDEILIRFDGCCGGPTEDLVTVGGGLEIADGDSSNFEATTAGTAVTSIDVGASSIEFLMRLSYNLDNQFFTFSGLDFGGSSILDAILSVSEIPEIIQSDVTFGSDWVRIEVGLQTPTNYSPDRLVRIDLVTSDVPSPAPLALLGLGLLAVSYTRKHSA